ncbi:hypothetical protein PsYK624_033530 [Phanerochaete sordida]|uniref:Uncharacterized protein n=1 Tax=Phanerochaete sordida TaxID=48140 RepID=A0A9P3G451_9APHY|nr:hypothetical protein PsYK624_033530 [Phanerochaete sordida]
MILAIDSKPQVLSRAEAIGLKTRGLLTENITPAAVLPYFVLESVLFGVHTILIGIVIFDTLLKYRISSGNRQFIRILCVVMYAVSSAHFGLAAAYIFGGETGESSSPARHVAVPAALPRLLVVNMTLGDMIVIWRAWLLWPRQRVVQAVSTLLLLGTVASQAYGAVTDVTFQGGVLSGIIMSWITNVWSTGIISWRTWKHRRVMKHDLGYTSARTQAEKALLIFVEAGVVYALFWTFIAAAKIYLYQRTDVLESASAAQHWPLYSFNWFINYMVICGFIEFVSIYPVTVVLLVDRTNSYYNRTLRLESVRIPRLESRSTLATPETDAFDVNPQDEQSSQSEPGGGGEDPLRQPARAALPLGSRVCYVMDPRREVGIPEHECLSNASCIEDGARCARMSPAVRSTRRCNL